jgi:hypothetical protein
MTRKFCFNVSIWQSLQGRRKRWRESAAHQNDGNGQLSRCNPDELVVRQSLQVLAFPTLA